MGEVREYVEFRVNWWVFIWLAHTDVASGPFSENECEGLFESFLL
jgi:hypothetical protein